MYKIIGADHNEYGPSSADEIRQWIAEGRADGRTLVKAEGSNEWKALASFPEFADALGTSPRAAAGPPLAEDYSTLPPDIHQRDYDLDIISCVTRAWGAVTGNLGTMVGGAVVYLVILAALGIAGQNREFVLPVALARICIEGPLMAGVFYFFLRNARGEAVEIGDLFAGFRLCFGTLVLIYVVQGLIMLLAALPGLVVFFMGFIPVMHKQQPTGNQIIAMAVGSILIFLPLVYFSISWMFSLLLAIDKRLTCWQAMETSRKIVGKHWWQLLGLSIVCGLIGFVSALLCCVPILVGIPVSMSAMAFAYEDIFGHRTGPGA
jgi:uncharacterized membrane protein